MTRLFLAAGVAALAITVPASAKPGGGNGGGHGGGSGAVEFHGGGGHGGGEGRAVRMQNFAPRGGGHEMRMQSFERHGGDRPMQAMRMQSFERHGGGDRSMRFMRMEGFDRHGGGQRMQAVRMHDMERRGGGERVANFDRGHGHGARQMRVIEHGDRDRAAFARHLPMSSGDIRDRVAIRDQMRAGRIARAQDVDNGFEGRFAEANGRGLINGCPPGLWKKDNGCLPPGQANKLLGTSVANAARIAALSSLPYSLRGFYPDTNDYYYRYGDGYLYRVDRTSNLINSVLPLLTGGYMPGTMFPSAYNYGYTPGYTFPNWYGSSYVPDYYGFNSFYPDTPTMDYRYLNGNVYGVDPFTGMIDNVIPTYAYGYGVGQVLPASYGYYNVPYQYRDLYYDTPDNNYWYAPGAIYQVDPSSQLITAVASLLAPGLSIGQQLPMGYDVYNVPYAYRSSYYDTPNAWYRYNNGYIYQVDPTTRIVTAIVASLLT